MGIYNTMSKFESEYRVTSEIYGAWTEPIYERKRSEVLKNDTRWKF